MPMPVGPVPALTSSHAYPAIFYPGLFGPGRETTYIASSWVLICGC